MSAGDGAGTGTGGGTGAGTGGGTGTSAGEVVRAFFGAFSRGDMGAVHARLAPNVVWHVPGWNAISGTYAGPDAVLAYFAKLRDLTGGTWKAHPIDLAVGSTGAVVVAKGEGQRGERRFASTYCLYLRIEEGLIAEARLYPEDFPAFDAFWS